jgi:hypothetical protein
VEGPEASLQSLGVELPGAVDSSVVAVLDPAHRVVVNGSFYWTSSAQRKAEFMAAPYRYAGAVRDPVTEAWFEPSQSSPRRDQGDEIVYFQSSESADAFGAKK